MRQLWSLVYRWLPKVVVVTNANAPAFGLARQRRDDERQVDLPGKDHSLAQRSVRLAFVPVADNLRVMPTERRINVGLDAREI
jgi:hypothetical protein